MADGLPLSWPECTVLVLLLIPYIPTCKFIGQLEHTFVANSRHVMPKQSAPGHALLAVTRCHPKSITTLLSNLDLVFESWGTSNMLNYNSEANS